MMWQTDRRTQPFIVKDRERLKCRSISPSLPGNQVRRRRRTWLKVKIVLASEDKMGHFVTLATCLQISQLGTRGLRHDLLWGERINDTATALLTVTTRLAPLSYLQGSIPAWESSSFSQDSSPSSWWRYMFLAPWQSPCLGCLSGWITRRWVTNFRTSRHKPFLLRCFCLPIFSAKTLNTHHDYI
mgnify:CR=1 FL=1